MDTIKIPLYWAELMKDLSDAEVGLIFKFVFLWAFKNFSEPSLFRKMMEQRDEVIRIADICLEDIRYQQAHPRSYRKPEERTAIRNSGAYSAWRKAVYERDQYTCQNCGKVGGKLNAHHIKSFARFPSLRLDVNNGITLCTECHKLAHERGFKNA